MAAILTCSSARAFGLAVLLAAPGAWAQDKSDASEAARHFDRGYLLAQQGSLEEAIEEFKRAQALSPHPSVLYNLGQAYAASGRAVEAVQTLRRYLEQADPKQDGERRAQASAVVDYQSQRIGLLKLEVEPTGAEVTIDGETRGKAPLESPVPLTAGTHGLAVAAPGYSPRHVRVEIEGKSSTSTSVRLEPSGAVTRLKVTCAVPDVTVHAQGLPTMKLPHGGELTFASPPTELRFERPGFMTTTRAIAADTSRAVDCSLAELDPRAKLLPIMVETSPSIAVKINGRPFKRGQLPPGRHALALSGAGVEASEQLILVGPERGEVSVDAREPGDAMVAERTSRRKLQLTLAIATSAAGAVSLGSAAALYAINQNKYGSWRDDSSALASRMARDPGSVSAGQWNDVLSRENELRNRDAAAIGLTVLGGALLTTGAVLWLTAPLPATSGVTLRIGQASWAGYTTTF